MTDDSNTHRTDAHMNSVTVAAPTKPLQGQVRWDPTLNKKLFTTDTCWQREKSVFSNGPSLGISTVPRSSWPTQHELHVFVVNILIFMDFLFHFGISLLYFTFIFNLFDVLVFIVL